MINLLITGAGRNGFIGKNLKELLCDNYNVFSPTREQLDLLDYEALKAFLSKNNIAVIVHGAIHVPIISGHEREMENDITMFLNIKRVSYMVNKIIYFGSGAEFDKRRDLDDIKELNIGDCLPYDSYGLSKYVMNELARSSKNIYNLRLFGIFGKYELWNIKLISNLCCKAIFDLPLTIRKNCEFDYLYVNDLKPILNYFIENKPFYHDYNITSGKAYKLTEIAKMVKQISNKNLDIILLSDERNQNYSGSNVRLIEEIKDIEITPLYNAIIELYEYYMNNKDIIDFDILKDSR